jgi:VWFA-related protein
MAIKSTGIWLRFIPIIGILWFGISATIHGQENQNAVQNTGRQAEKAGDNFKIKVSVEEVRLDAVVVDGRGRQITGLTADDFEIYQDKQQQEIIECKYMSYNPARPGQRALSSPDFGKIPPVPGPFLKREAVQRILVFLVNDFGMDHGVTYYARMSLRRFVERQMLPGDLISIIKTSRGSATLQAFTSDKRELLSRIEAIQWSTYNDLPTVPREAALRTEHNSQLVAINYCIKAIQDMPGRKFLILITPNNMGPRYFYPAYDKMADLALRAGVVVHTLPAGGIKVREDMYVSSLYQMEVSKQFDRILDYNRLGDYESARGHELPLSRKTGGIFLDNNYFINGIGDLEDEIKGYYLLSYIPPEKTFFQSGKTKYHKVKIKVKRKGASVHTRDGFFGEPAVLETPASPPPPLVEAMFSPFRYSDLNVDLNSGYIDTLPGGYRLPTWIHLDGRDLSVVEEGDGGRSVSFEAAASTTDIDGIFQDYSDMKIGFPVDQTDIQKLRENGINFTISIPVKKPGSYYVRVAVMDQASGAKGSAYQFIEIPDLKKSRLALSSLYIIDREDDAAWIRSMATKEAGNPPDSSRQYLNRNPARKNFRPGDSFEYMTVIYNAKTKKETPPDLESGIVLYRDGVAIYQSEAEALDLSGISDFKRIPVRKRLRIDNSMQPGDYVLQFLVKDKLAKEKQNLTAQTLSFRVGRQ